MREAMIPRGPDGCGLEAGPGFALGHRRLSIIDLSNVAGQPMANEDGRVLIVFNGEIYNFGDLRPELERAGHRFRSHGDTEVLVHGYEQWGLEGLLRRIRGMYAFALLDLGRREAHLARDPLGKKPLFYRWAGGELAFASSARALALGLAATPEVSPAAIDDLLWTRCISGSETIFAGVAKVPPGEAWSLRGDGTSAALVHWRPDCFRHEEGVEPEEWLERIDGAVRVAVRRRFVADVPVGVMLSGGVDSSLISAIAAQTVGRIKTFNVANEDPAADESAYARAVAQRYGTDHCVLAVRSNVRTDLPRLVAAMGEPLADASAANLFAIAQVARQSVTVVLTGDGGDEAFGGYTEAWAADLAERVYRRLPRFCRAPLAAGAAVLHHGAGAVHRAGSFLYMISRPLEETFGKLWTEQSTVRDGLYTDAFRARLAGHDPRRHYYAAVQGDPADPWSDRIMRFHFETVLPDDFLPKVDLTTMGASLEARCPLLDLDVLEIALRVPPRLRFADGQPKGLLRRLARRHVPAHTVNRRKQGFSAPVALWFRESWGDLVQEFILGPHVERRAWFRRDALERLVAEHHRGVDRGNLLWALLILELWTRIAVDRTLAPSDAI